MKCYSTVHLTTRLLRHEPGRREAAAYHFGLPADKPLMSQLIVKRLSRHKHFRDMIGRRDCSVWNSRSIRPLAWGMLVVLDLPNHGWREASIWIISPQYWHLGRRGCGSSAKSSFSAGWNVRFLHIKWCRHLRYIKTLSYAKHKVSCCRCKKRSFKCNE